jgi:hypothetical protein
MTTLLDIESDDPAHIEVGGAESLGELIVDGLWSDFFTIGSTFNDLDWDAFLVDLDGQITRV